jgi:hypothetical protein
MIFENSEKAKDAVVTMVLTHFFFIDCINVFKMNMEDLVMETIKTTI